MYRIFFKQWLQLLLLGCYQAEQAVEMLTRDLKSKQHDLDMSEG